MNPDIRVEKPAKKIAKKRAPARKPPSTSAAIKAAERALKARHDAHRKAFRVACARLFNEFGYALVADGDLSAHLKIESLNGPSGLAVEFLITDIPE